MKKPGRPSPAMIVACVALIAALGGTAVAAKTITGKKAKKIANTQITKRQGKLNVKSAKTADSATTADSAKNVYFATVDYDDATPTVLSGTPGITGNGETIQGTPRLDFPRDMDPCSITATPFNGGGTQNEIAMRRSTTSDGSIVRLALWRTDNNNSIRSDFSIVAVCP
jgi:hypothetical protein